MVYNSKEKRYVGVSCGKGGGARVVQAPRSITYNDILKKKLCETFSPIGRLPLGKENKYEHKLGDAACQLHYLFFLK